MRVLALLCVFAASGALAGGAPDGFTPAVDDHNKYCMYSIMTTLSSYTFLDDSTSSNSSSSGSSSSSSSSSGHGSSSSSSSSSSGQDSSSSSASGQTSHGSKFRRGHKSASSTSCTSTVEASSLYAACLLYCTGSQFEAGLTYWNESCVSAGTPLIDLTSIKANVTPTYAYALPRIDPETNSTTTTGTISSPVLLLYSYYRRAYKSYTAHDDAIPKDIRYGWGILAFWGGVLVLGILGNLRNAWSLNRYTISTADVESTGAARKSSKASGGIFGTIKHQVRTHLIIPAAFGTWSNHRQYWYWNMIPKRLDSVIVGAFWILAILLNCLGYDTFSGNIQTPSVPEQNWAYVSDRTGITSYACIPLLWLFGMRNNIFLWATGWSFTTFSVFHRHVARVCVVLAIAHSIAYTVIFQVYDGRYKSSLAQNYFYMGIVATVVMTMMLVFSHDWVRHKFYETFLLIHIVFAIVSLYSLYCHTDYDAKRYNGYLWAAVAVWSIDRLVRWVRIIYCNIHVRFGSDFLSVSKSSVTYSKESDTVRIDIYAPGTLKAGPGQYYHIYQPFSLRGWENHPFTLGAYNTGSSTSQSTSPLSTGKNETQTSVVAADHGNHSTNGNNTILTFWVRPYDGWTKRLRDKCLKSESGVIHPKLLLEGPYGSHVSLHKFDTQLLVVGGTGVAAAVPRLIEHIKDSAAHRTHTSKIHLIWAIKNRSSMDELAHAELAAALEREDFYATIFCTRQSAAEAEASSSSEGLPSSPSEKGSQTRREPTFSPRIEFFYARPNVSDLVQQAVAEAESESRSVGIICCGPPQMADDCRLGVYQSLKAGHRRVEYVEEAFGW